MKFHDHKVQEIYERKRRDPLEMQLPNESIRQMKNRLMREAWKDLITLKISAKVRKILEANISIEEVHPAELQENLLKISVQVFDTPDPVGRQERMEQRNTLVRQLHHAVEAHLKNPDLKDTDIMIRE